MDSNMLRHFRLQETASKKDFFLTLFLPNSPKEQLSLLAGIKPVYTSGFMSEPVQFFSLDG